MNKTETEVKSIAEAEIEENLKGWESLGLVQSESVNGVVKWSLTDAGKVRLAEIEASLPLQHKILYKIGDLIGLIWVPTKRFSGHFILKPNKRDVHTPV